MHSRDIIVIGTSAGGVEAMLQLARALPAQLPAAVFVVSHLAPESHSMLPALLSNIGALPALHPVDKTPVRNGTITIAPPDHHLVLEDGHIRVVRGPKENGFRPSVDALFRTAARAYGERVIGVVLTGMLDDGTAGLRAIKRHGGLAIVQDPADAAFPSMPQSALRYVAVDTVCVLDELAPLLVRLVQQPGSAQGGVPAAALRSAGPDPAPGDRAALDAPDLPDTLAPHLYPDCGSVLMEFLDGDLLGLRCQVGTISSHDNVLTYQAAQLNHNLRAAFRALNERQQLLEHLTHDAKQLNDSTGARRFQRLVVQARTRKEQVRLALLKAHHDDVEQLH